MTMTSPARTATRPNTAADFRVADLSLAAFGRKEIQLAEHEMPGLMAMRREFGSERPLRGARVEPDAAKELVEGVAGVKDGRPGAFGLTSHPGQQEARKRPVGIAVTLLPSAGVLPMAGLNHQGHIAVDPQPERDRSGIPIGEVHLGEDPGGEREVTGLGLGWQRRRERLMYGREWLHFLLAAAFDQGQESLLLG
jgi:hypothetical protein